MNKVKKYGERSFFTEISEAENCVKILKNNEVVATINKRDRVIVKGYNSLILPKYIEVEANAKLDTIPDEPFYEELTDYVFANELDYTQPISNEIL